MVNQEQKELVDEIIIILLEIGQRDKVDIFFDYSGHVNSFNARINFDTSYGSGSSHNQILNMSVYLSNNATEGLQQILHSLNELEIPDVNSSRSKRVNELKKEIERLEG